MIGGAAASLDSTDNHQSSQMSASSSSSAAAADGVATSPPCCISHHFSLLAARNPDLTAVIHAPPPGEDRFTYSHLSAAVASLTRRLRRLLPPTPAHPCIVGVHIPPSFHYIAAVLSILRSGSAFLPLDPSWPPERIQSIVADCNAAIVVRCRGTGEGDVDWGSVGVETVYADDAGESGGEEEEGETVWPCEKAREFCYVMYTSGSTGKPKGVCGTEKGLLNRFWWMQKLFPMDREDVLLFKTSISFIDHLQEFLGAILTCTPLVVPSYVELKTTALYMVQILEAYQISRLTAVPSLMRAILSSFRSLDVMQVRSRLKMLVLSGEILSLSLWKLLQDYLPDTIILNLYGSTEVSGDCTYFNCESLPKIIESNSLDSVPIGMPISNCELTVLGESETSDEGEICVTGACLMTGYFGQSAKDTRSISHFRTGDFARRLQSGDLIFIGRKDRTVKVNGQRIALEEIENTLREHPEVRDAAVTLSRPNGGPMCLDAYFTIVSTERFQHLDIDQQHIVQGFIVSIRSWLVRKLPSAMIPSRYFYTEELPLSASGKIDYTKLSSSSVAARPRSEYERNHFFDYHLENIRKAFCSALQVKEITDFDDFFMMGGNSISAAYVAHKLGIGMRMLYIFPSPFDLLNAIFDQKIISGDSFVGNRETGKRLKVHENLLSSFEASNVGVQDSWPPGGMLHGNRGEKVHDLSGTYDGYHLTNQLETNGGSLAETGSLNDYFQPRAPNVTISVDYGPWISKVNLPKMCSFSRCNQFMHEGPPLLDNLQENDSPIEMSRCTPRMEMPTCSLDLTLACLCALMLSVVLYAGKLLWEVVSSVRQQLLEILTRL